MEEGPPAGSDRAAATPSAADRRAAERDARLAAALRTNLRRRKAQFRARRDADAEAGGEPPRADRDDRGA